MELNLSAYYAGTDLILAIGKGGNRKVIRIVMQ